MTLNVSLLKTSFLILILNLWSCSSPLSNRSVSPIDSRYKLSKIKTDTKASSGINFYQDVLKKAWGSHCKWFPHDSKNAQMLLSKCGVLKGAPKTFARFLNESNASQLGYDLVITKGKIYFEDIPRSCHYF